MKVRRRVFTREFKLAAIKELDSGKTTGYVGRRLEIDTKTLRRWRREFKREPATAFVGHGNRLLANSREAELERKIGQLTMENDFLKKVLESMQDQQRDEDGEGRFMKGRGKKASR
jgi:transposase-like protein